MQLCFVLRNCLSVLFMVTTVVVILRKFVTIGVGILSYLKKCCTLVVGTCGAVLATVLFSQGINILLNMFFGPFVNAARGIAVQVQGAVTQFSTNFQTALNPQITKSYALGDFTYMHSLIFRSSKFTFLLLAVISFPILLETEMILQLWLNMVPAYTVVFVRLMLCITIIDAMGGAFMVAAQSTGRVRFYQSVVGGILLAYSSGFLCSFFGWGLHLGVYSLFISVSVLLHFLFVCLLFVL